MGGQIQLPTRECHNITVVQISQFIFGKRVTIQAHNMGKVGRGKDPCDGHECSQVEAKGDIKFFSRGVDISKI